jgi:hypothetical protein
MRVCERDNIKMCARAKEKDQQQGCNTREEEERKREQEREREEMRMPTLTTIDPALQMTLLCSVGRCSS